MQAANEILEIVTCSYRPDLHRCRRLCESVDRFVPEAVTHTVIVPRRDVAVFSGLENQRRRIIPVEQVVPGRYRQLPLADKLWMDPQGWPVRGWVMQQVVKLSASHAVGAELILFADSDLQFIRPVQMERLVRSGRLRLHRVPDAESGGRHLRWHERAGELLGRPQQYHGSDYVGQLITWRRSNLLALHNHIESVTGLPWHRSVARSIDVSEYILYGSFVEHVLGYESSGHFFDESDICHCCWFDSQARALLEGSVSPAPDVLALHVQSNLEFSPAYERAVLDAALSESLAAEIRT